jgi:hypothetical protein
MAFLSVAKRFKAAKGWLHDDHGRYDWQQLSRTAVRLLIWRF